MSQPCDCNPCSTSTPVQIPGTPGADATSLPPDTVTNPNGLKTALYPGQFYFCTANSSLWIALAVGNSSWKQLIAPSA